MDAEEKKMTGQITWTGKIADSSLYCIKNISIHNSNIRDNEQMVDL